MSAQTKTIRKTLALGPPELAMLLGTSLSNLKRHEIYQVSLPSKARERLTTVQQVSQSFFPGPDDADPILATHGKQLKPWLHGKVEEFQSQIRALEKKRKKIKDQYMALYLQVAVLSHFLEENYTEDDAGYAEALNYLAARAKIKLAKVDVLKLFQIQLTIEGLQKQIEVATTYIGEL